MNIPKVVLLGVGIGSLIIAVGCAGGQARPTPDTDATVEARVKPAEASISVPTAAPLPTNTKTAYAPGPTPAPQVVIEEEVNEVPAEVVVKEEVKKIVEVVVTATPGPVPTAKPSSTPIPSPTPRPTEFWNRSLVFEEGKLPPSCGDSIFTHPVVDPEDATPSFSVNKVYPHSHMVYMGTRVLDEGKSRLEGVHYSEQVQLYAPADIYHMQVWRTVRESHDGGSYEDWAIKADICEGSVLIFGHVGRPIEEILVEVRKADIARWSDCPVSTTEEALATPRVGSCVWGVFFNPPISAGTPISKSSGYSGGFDFGFELIGLTAEELRQHPSYGYSINPWAYSGGTSVCTLDYFPEPYRSSYLESMEGKCGPFNQDVPGTAMGVWLPAPPPADGSAPDRGPGTVWQLLRVGGDGVVLGLYLFEDSKDDSFHQMNSGTQVPGIPAGKFRIETVSDGLVNREWDSVVPGEVYCAELNSTNINTATEVMLIEVSEDGRTLTIEVITGTKCPDGPYSFSPDAHTMYR